MGCAIQILQKTLIMSRRTMVLKCMSKKVYTVLQDALISYVLINIEKGFFCEMNSHRITIIDVFLSGLSCFLLTCAIAPVHIRTSMPRTCPCSHCKSSVKENGAYTGWSTPWNSFVKFGSVNIHVAVKGVFVDVLTEYIVASYS